MSARGEVQRILRACKPGDEVVGEELATVLAAFRNHPRWAEKAGAGVARVVVEQGPGGWNMFTVVRLDGTVVDISYKKCFARPADEGDGYSGVPFGQEDRGGEDWLGRR